MLSALDRRARLAALVIAAASVIHAVQPWQGAGSVPWYEPLLLPGVIGFMLVGGVHGGAPPWLMVLAYGVANAGAWGLLAYGLTRLLSRAGAE